MERGPSPGYLHKIDKLIEKKTNFIEKSRSQMSAEYFGLLGMLGNPDMNSLGQPRRAMLEEAAVRLENQLGYTKLTVATADLTTPPTAAATSGSSSGSLPDDDGENQSINTQRELDIELQKTDLDFDEIDVVNLSSKV